MKINYYAVKDELANRFLAPTLIKSDELALRQFRSQINNIELWKDNPSDFSLYRLGEWDDETGILVSSIEKLAGGRSVKE